LREEGLAEERPGAFLVPPLPLCDSTLVTLEGEPAWYMGLSAGFARGVSGLESSVYMCLLDAVARIAEYPLTGVASIPKAGHEQEMQCVWEMPACDIIYGVDRRARLITLWEIRRKGCGRHGERRRQPHSR